MRQLQNRWQNYLCLTFLISMAFIPAAFSSNYFSIANRNIFSFNQWPNAMQKADLTSGTTYQLQTLNRLIFNQRNENFRFKFEAEIYGTHLSEKAFGSNANWQTDRRQTGYKKWKTEGKMLSRERNFLAAEIERCEFSFSRGIFDFQIGRQPISFGTSHYVSVLDILAPFQPGYLDSSYKPGIDALRIRTLSGDTGEIELIVAAAAEPGDNAVIGRWRNTFSGFDFEILGGRMRKRDFIGLAWEGERKQINFWGELGFFSRRTAQDRHFGGFSRNFASSWICGLEKDTGSDWRHGLAYFHQDFGARSTQNLGAAYATLPLQQGWVHLAGSDYIIINSSKEITPLINLNLNCMLSMTDHSALFQPVLNISLDDESDISFFALVNSGTRPDLSPANGAINLRSEFASFPSGAGFILRRFF